MVIRPVALRRNSLRIAAMWLVSKCGAWGDGAWLADAVRQARPKTALTLLVLLGTVGVAQAASVQVNVDAAPKLCTRFLADLRGDHIAKMTMGQLCRYDFVERHAGSFYRQLDWQPVPGDPVALTMKIYDASVPAPLRRTSNKERAALLQYARTQNRHHALRVEIAPFRVENPNIPGSGSVPGKGYILRSRGSYCGMADKRTDNPAADLKNATGRILTALFADRALQHPVLDNGRNLFTKSLPVEIDGRDMVIGLGTVSLHYKGFDPVGAGQNYGADIESKGFIHSDNDPAKPLVVYSRPICDYTVYIKYGVK